MKVKVNEVYMLEKKLVKVGKLQGFNVLAREPKGGYRPVSVKKLKKTKKTLDDFRVLD
jgi:uncharacterized secreted protein with C-terminal beta-propeller domain